MVEMISSDPMQICHIKDWILWFHRKPIPESYALGKMFTEILKVTRSFENVSLANRNCVFQKYLRKNGKSSVTRVICARFLSVSERSV